MALLSFKKMVFPDKKTTLNRSRSNGQGKPLLSSSDDPWPINNDVDCDLEGQTPSYDTFENSAEPDVRSAHSSDSSSSSGSRWRVNPRIVSDAILGLSDGLTVPFALSAGLSALGDTKVVVLGGLAELAAGAISMGLGGYVGAKSETEHFQTTVQETQELVQNAPSETATIISEIFSSYELGDEAIDHITKTLQASPERLQEFLISFHRRESAPDGNQPWVSAITLAIGYFVGGFIPLIPYFIATKVLVALYWSIGVMAVTLFVFGYVKTGIVRGWSGKGNVLAAARGGLQMCVVGGLAAGAAMALVWAIDTGKA